MITLLNYEKAQGGDYVCHFSVGSTDMTYAEAEKEFKKISDSAFVVSPATMSIPFALGVPGYGSTITMHYNTGVTVFYKAGEYTSDVIRGDEILDDPGAVDVSWKTIFESGEGELTIFPKTHDGKEYYAMTGCFAPEIGFPLEITENGHYGWPMDKDTSEWTEEEWGQGPITDVYVNVPPQSAPIGTVVGTPTQVKTGETEAGDPQYETLYCIEYDALKTIMDSSAELVFQLSDSQYTRPLMGIYNSGISSAFEIVEYLDRDGTTERTAPTKFIYIIDSNKQNPQALDYEQRRFVQDNVPSKIPYNIYNYFT